MIKILNSKSLPYWITALNLLILYGVAYSWKMERISSEKTILFILPVDFFHFGLLMLGILYLVQKSVIDYIAFKLNKVEGDRPIKTVIVSNLLFALGIIGIWFVDLGRALDLANWGDQHGPVTNRLVHLSTTDVFNTGCVFQVLSTMLQSVVFVRLQRTVTN